MLKNDRKIVRLSASPYFPGSLYITHLPRKKTREKKTIYCIRMTLTESIFADSAGPHDSANQASLTDIVNMAEKQRNLAT